MLQRIKLRNTLLVGAITVFASCGGQKEVKMGSYAYSGMARTGNDYFRFR